ncbi:hypothetical protein CRG98_005003 [Punica granatum]|uniref:Uncharacterized protein n=1 Tax=Punica granatum TaxID=22663 RepID=A0A2I0L3F6_PUNGR|nr:hypothetical protein CRG98_005003 [Punica granatum]
MAQVHRSSWAALKSEERRDAMAEWYMASWNDAVPKVIFLSCLAFSSVKHPGANRACPKVLLWPGSQLELLSGNGLKPM